MKKNIPRQTLPLHRFSYSTSLSGFTMAELVIILSIMTVISSIVLFSFTGLSERGSLNRSVRELALALRSAQGMALSVTQIGVGSPPVNRIPPAVGIKFIRGANSYRVFADLNARDFKYTGNNENIGEPRIMEKSVRVNNLTYYNALGQAQSAPSAHIIFSAPEASMDITDGSGLILGTGEQLEIELTPSAAVSCQVTLNPCKKIIVRASGQINIK